MCVILIKRVYHRWVCDIRKSKRARRKTGRLFDGRGDAAGLIEGRGAGVWMEGLVLQAVESKSTRNATK